MTNNLFLGIETQLPSIEIEDGKKLKEEDLHLTLIFFGKKEPQRFIEKLSSLPPPPFVCAPIALCYKELLFNSVAAFDVQLLNKKALFDQWRDCLCAFFDYKDTRPFLPHVTMARNPMHVELWKNLPFPFPCFFKALHLYQSLGHSVYKKLWSSPFPPFSTCLDHTADYGFIIYGSTMSELYLHALITLAMDFAVLRNYVKEKECFSIEDVVIGLNEVLSTVDERQGIGIKAVSFSSNLHIQDNLLKWEMIIDI